LNLLNDNVIVSNDLPIAAQLLRRSIVSVGSVGEDTGLHALRIQDNRECGVGSDVTIIGGELKLAGRHVIDTGYITHGRRVTRASLNLLAICEGLALAEVDEIVVADKGVRFAIRLSFTINVLNDAGIQSEGTTISSITVGAIVVTPTVLVVVTTILVVVPTVLGAVPAILVIVPTVLGAVPAVLVVVPTVPTVAAVTAVLTDYKTIRLRDEEGGGKLGNGEKNKREL